MVLLLLSLYFSLLRKPSSLFSSFSPFCYFAISFFLLIETAAHGFGTGGSYVRRGKDRPARCTVAGPFFRVLGYLSYLGTAYSRTTSTRKNRVLAYFLEPWNVLRWRWLSTWCGKFFKCFPTPKFVCIHQMKIFSWYGKNCTNSFLVIRACTGCMALLTMGSTEVVVAEHMVWDSFWCLQIP